MVLIQGTWLAFSISKALAPPLFDRYKSWSAFFTKGEPHPLQPTLHNANALSKPFWGLKLCVDLGKRWTSWKTPSCGRLSNLNPRWFYLCCSIGLVGVGLQTWILTVLSTCKLLWKLAALGSGLKPPHSGKTPFDVNMWWWLIMEERFRLRAGMKEPKDCTVHSGFIV